MSCRHNRGGRFGRIYVLFFAPCTSRVSLYDAVFYGMLPDSPDPRADLHALGLSADYERYSGTLPWSPGTGVADGTLINALQEKVTPLRLVGFYLKRPVRLFGRLEKLLPSYLSLRPEFCGNFEASSGQPPGARSDSFAFWSRFHEKVLSKAALGLLSILFLLTFTGTIIVLGSRKLRRSTVAWIELGTCLGACCLTSFFVAAFGDVYDNTKHQFLFSLLLDTCLVFGACAGATALVSTTNYVNIPDRIRALQLRNLIPAVTPSLRKISTQSNSCKEFPD